ncbi:MAG TPA: FABP family protein [Actinomycetota bacterium]|nr:FABP family protein [Actinomycetota bacterium]
MAPDVHPDVQALAFLLGTWRGVGRGDYPTIDPFAYREEMVFEHVGDPFLLYRQESWDASSGDPLHFERGFLRPGGGEGSVELCLAHPLGLTEIALGTVDGGSLTLEAAPTQVGRTPTGLDVARVLRRYRVTGEALTYELDMATDRTPLTWHLAATLERSS